MSLEPLETAQGSGYPGCVQLSVFLDNRVGQLLRLMRLLDGSEVHILALSVEGSIDCAIVRLLVDEPDEARTTLTHAGFAVTESEVIVVQLPPGKRGLLQVCQALIGAEVNIQYAYPMLALPDQAATLAINVDDISVADTVLRERKFRVLDQSEL